MSMTLWLQTRVQREFCGDSDDYSELLEQLDELDALCERAGVTPLSHFLDTTDQEYEHGLDDGGFDDSNDEPRDEDRDDDDFDEDDEAVDPETGLAYGIDDMHWFDASAGVSSLVALRQAMAHDLILCEELDSCLSILRPVAAAGGHFHLALIS